MFKRVQNIESNGLRLTFLSSTETNLISEHRPCMDHGPVHLGVSSGVKLALLAQQMHGETLGQTCKVVPMRINVMMVVHKRRVVKSHLDTPVFFSVQRCKVQHFGLSM